MPSNTRRSVSLSSSALSQRVSPYPSMTTRSQTAAALQSARRASRADTTSRQVLADIEWWRVVCGQEPGETPPINNDMDDIDVTLAGNVAPEIPIEDMENIDFRNHLDAATTQAHVFTTVPPSPTTSTAPSSRGGTPPRGGARRTRTRRSISFAGFDMMLRIRMDTNSNELPTIHDNTNANSPFSTYDASARRV